MNIIPLTNKQNKSILKQKVCYMFIKEISTDSDKQSVRLGNV